MKPECLAQIAGFARIERCGHCTDLHITVGPLSFRMGVDSFDYFLNMLLNAQLKLRTERQQDNLKRSFDVNAPLNLN